MQPNLGWVISVVVPAWNAAAVVPPLLDALAVQTATHEVVLVDAGSSDDTAAVAEAAGARVVTAPQRNRSLARNVGVAAAHGDLIAFTDTDCVPDPGWAEALAHCLASSPVASGPIRIQAGAQPNMAERFDLLWRYPQERYAAAGFGASANLGFRREAFEAVGGFDPRHHHGEDMDLCLRAPGRRLRAGLVPRGRGVASRGHEPARGRAARLRARRIGAAPRAHAPGTRGPALLERARRSRPARRCAARAVGRAGRRPRHRARGTGGLRGAYGGLAVGRVRAPNGQMTAEPEISVIVPARDAAVLLPSLFAALDRTTFEGAVGDRGRG